MAAYTAGAAKATTKAEMRKDGHRGVCEILNVRLFCITVLFRDFNRFHWTNAYQIKVKLQPKLQLFGEIPDFIQLSVGFVLIAMCRDDTGNLHIDIGSKTFELGNRRIVNSRRM